MNTPGIELASKSPNANRLSLAKSIADIELGLALSRYTDFDQPSLERVSAESLTEVLLDTPGDVQGIYEVRFLRDEPDGDQTEVGVPLWPNMYITVVKHVGSMVAKAQASVQTNTAKGGRYGRKPESNPIAESQRQLGTKLTTLTQRRNGLAVKTLEKVTDYQHHSEYPHFYWKPKPKIKREVRDIFNYTFSTILDAASFQANWTDEQKYMARQALNYSLIVDRKDNARLKRWHDLLGVNKQYWTNLRDLLTSRIDEIAITMDVYDAELAARTPLKR